MVDSLEETSTTTVRAVVGIIIQARKVLVAQRPQGKPYSGYWEFPGGKIEKNEEAYHALKRELHEELGIHVIAAQSWAEYTHAYPDKTVLLYLWLVTQFNGVPINRENQNLRWVSLEELSKLKILEGNIAILENLKSVLSARREAKK